MEQLFIVFLNNNTMKLFYSYFFKNKIILILNLNILFLLLINIYNILKKIHIYLGIGDWGLGIGDWGLGPLPHTPTPIPNPQTPNPKHKSLLKYYH